MIGMHFLENEENFKNENSKNWFTFSFKWIDGWRWANEWTDVILILSSDVNDGVDRNEPPDGTVVSSGWLLLIARDSRETCEGNLMKRRMNEWIIK